MAMVYDITNDTPANEGNMAIIKPYELHDSHVFRLSLAAINYKYGGGEVYLHS